MCPPKLQIRLLLILRLLFCISLSLFHCLPTPSFLAFIQIHICILTFHPCLTCTLGDWLRHYRVNTRVGIPAQFGVRKLLVMIRGAFVNDYNGGQSVSEVIFTLGSASAILVQGLAHVALGYDSTIPLLFIYGPNPCSLNTLLM